MEETVDIYEDMEMFKEVLKRQDLLSKELPEEKEFLKPKRPIIPIGLFPKLKMEK